MNTVDLTISNDLRITTALSLDSVVFVIVLCIFIDLFHTAIQN